MQRWRCFQVDVGVRLLGMWACLFGGGSVERVWKASFAQNDELLEKAKAAFAQHKAEIGLTPHPAKLLKLLLTV